MQHYDFVVLGSGPAGRRAAVQAAKLGKSVLVIDERDRPQRLLASSNLTGTGQALPYQLRFNPEAFPPGARVELRGRASNSGQLIMHLPPVRITQAQTQATGPLRFEKAP